MCEIGEPTGPMENGMTYIVLPRMHPENSPLSVDLMDAGSIQLLLGPASCSSCVQM